MAEKWQKVEEKKKEDENEIYLNEEKKEDHLYEQWRLSQIRRFFYFISFFKYFIFSFFFV